MNGRRVRQEEALVSVYDHGFLYGMGLFETMRTYCGSPFLLDRHLARLADGCRELGIQYEPDAEQLQRHIAELLAANRLSDGYVRISVSAGIQPLGLPTGDYAEPNVIVYVKELPPSAPPEGKPLQLLKLRRNTPESDIRMKSFHYMNSILARRELASYPWAAGAEGLQLDPHGYAAEGIVSNVFFAAAGRIRTPSLRTGILPGITRAHVIELAEQAGIPVEEGLYRTEQLADADEIWLTNSVQEIVPVHTVYDAAGNVLWRTRSRAMTDRLRALYAQSVQAGQ